MLILSLLLVFISIGLIVYILIPVATAMSQKQAHSVVGKVDRYFQEEDIKKAYKFVVLGPIVLGTGCFVSFPPDKRVIGLIIGLVLGYILPRMHISRMINIRKQKFNDQLMDALMIMSSSFRGGLSLIQAFESVVDEMNDPVKGEFGIVLGENKMGVSLDESLNRFYRRMPSPNMQQMVTAILLARETGGNLPIIFSRIISTMRERKKIEQNLVTLTIQGKIQAVVMTGLPVFFFFGISATNPHFFDTMLTSPDGKKLLMISAVLWVLGALTIWKISTFKDI